MSEAPAGGEDETSRTIRFGQAPCARAGRTSSVLLAASRERRVTRMRPSIDRVTPLLDDAIGGGARESKIEARHCAHARRTQHAEAASTPRHRAADAPKMGEDEARIVLQPEADRAVDPDMRGPDQRDLEQMERR